MIYVYSNYGSNYSKGNLIKHIFETIIMFQKLKKNIKTILIFLYSEQCQQFVGGTEMSVFFIYKNTRKCISIFAYIPTFQLKFNFRWYFVGRNCVGKKNIKQIVFDF